MPQFLRQLFFLLLSLHHLYAVFCFKNALQQEFKGLEYVVSKEEYNYRKFLLTHTDPVFSYPVIRFLYHYPEKYPSTRRLTIAVRNHIFPISLHIVMLRIHI